LLAQVDSSIGGKTGINHPMGKNLIGAFKQPAFVLSDIHLLKTLDPPEIRCGLGEVVKYAFIGNPLLFEYLEQNIQNALDGETQVLEHIVSVCSAQKGYVVENDEKESGLRMTLNYGHTFGHALEAHYGYKDLKHGEAIILGMKCALHFSRLNREIDEEDYNRGMALLNRVPVQYDSSLINPQQLLNRMYLDKKVSDKVIRLMLVNKIGECRPVLVSDVELIKKAFEVLI
jgi:3-dehydroquinate synthetase